MNAAYRSPRWRELRARVWQRAEGACEQCGERGGRLAVHHVVPLADGGEPFPPIGGLRLLCRDCHYKAHRPHDPERERWRLRLAILERS